MKNLSLLSTFLLAAFAFADDPSWIAPHAPYQITDNIYNVGTDGIAVYLITTPEGNILVDAAPVKGAAIVEANIKTLGFKLGDIKYLLENHAHSDHVGGLARLKKSTGAKLIASQGDRYSLEHGKLDSDANWEDKFPPVKVDRTLAQGEQVTLGGVSLTTQLTPGHTKGATSWIIQSTSNGTEQTVIILSSLTVAGNKLIGNKTYPTIVDDYRATFARLKGLKADILLTCHPTLVGLEEKYQAQLQGKKDAFVNPQEFPKYVADWEAAFEQELNKQIARTNNSK